MSIEGASYRAAVARLIDRYGTPADFFGGRR
jgi:hypothetical protein